ncbi:MAG: hypothetical protein HY738_02570 [Bacteroidia bacterium]|nr:hypothetical protein [Bacteroidia bacterium]
MLIAGTGGLGKEVLGMLIDEGYDGEIYFFDENQNAPEHLYGKFKVFKSFDDVSEHFRTIDNTFITAVGHPRIREKLTGKLEAIGGKLISAISKKTSIFPFNEKPEGIIIQPGVGISHNVRFGKCCAVHINSTIGHSSNIGNYVNIAPSVTIIGPATIGDYSYISAQAIVMPNHKIGKHVIVGSGALVNRDINDYETFE